MTIISKDVTGSKFPFSVELDDIDLREDGNDILVWCGTQFGDGTHPGGGIDYDKPWIFNVYSNCIRFKKEADRIWFIMRWS